MRIAKLSIVGGVEVEGIDLSGSIALEMNREIGRLFDDHGLVVFRDQKLTKKQLHKAGDIFGGCMTEVPGTALDPEVPGIVVVSTRGAAGDVVPADGDQVVGDIEWHRDQAFTTKPPRGRMLYAVQVPDEGGLTGYIDGCVAYDALAAETKARIDKLHVIHSWRHAEKTLARNRTYHRDGDKALATNRYPDVAFPLVYSHPVTDVKILNVPPLWAAGIVEMPGAEGEALVEDLKQHLVQRQFQYWHKYRTGDVVLWDNWRFVHAAGGTKGRYARTLWSVAIKVDIEMGSVIPSAA